MYLGFICGLLKFGSGTVVSIVLGLDPVLLKGWRHFVSFTIALLCVQATPNDVFYKVLSAPDIRGLFLRSIVYMACALYKLRKLTFVVHMTRNVGYGLHITVALCVLELEGLAFCADLKTTSRMSDGPGRASKMQSLSTWQLVSAINFWLSITGFVRALRRSECRRCLAIPLSFAVVVDDSGSWSALSEV